MSHTKEPTPPATVETSPPPSKKRKRNILPEEVEVDVNAAEPPSKKALRAAKKAEKRKPASTDEAGEPIATKAPDGDAAQGKAATTGADQRGQCGIWIGNLPFSATKDSLRTFLKDYGSIEASDIARLNMPAPIIQDKTARVKPTNKGFAYVDFTSEDILQKALDLSETLMGGRKVLIKNAKSFEGRPDKKKEDGEKAPEKLAKPPSKRIFVGNLSFDVTKEDLTEHFAQAGEIEDVHMATFEDSGKCKGFAWVRYVEVESAEAAVKGWILKKNVDDSASEDEDEQETKTEAAADASDASDSETESKPKAAPAPSKHRKPRKPMKWFINRLQGRPLRCEFAEDAQLRYKKRFGSAKTDAEGISERPQTDRGAPSGERAPRSKPRPIPEGDAEFSTLVQDAATARVNRKSGLDKDQRRAERSKRHLDARSIAPGAALANAPRASGAIVAGAGKKTTF